MRQPTYAKYKQSGVDWLGEVPDHWFVKAIKWESPVLRGASPRPIDNPVYFDDDGEYGWVRITDVTNAGMYLEETTQHLSELGASLSVRLRCGSLFLSIAATVGKPCIARVKCCIHDGFVYFPLWKGETRFLYYLFASGEPYRGLGKLGTQLNLNTDTVGAIKAGFPPKAEQMIIADFLDRKIAEIDTLITKKRTLIAKLSEKRSALILRTVTRGLPPEAAHGTALEPIPKMKPSGIEWLGEVPEHWRVRRLGQLADKVGSGKTPKGGAETYQSEGVLLIRSQNVQNAGLQLEDAVFITDKVDEEMAGTRVRSADVLLNITGASLGRCAVVPENLGRANVNQHVCIIRLHTARALPSFVARAISSHALQSQIYSFEAGSSREGLNFQQVRGLLLALPSIPEQHAIAEFLNREAAKIDALVSKIEQAIERLQEYRTALITAAVTGKIDVRQAEKAAGIHA